MMKTSELEQEGATSSVGVSSLGTSSVDGVSGVQDEINREAYHAPDSWRCYPSRALLPSEIGALLRYQPHLAGGDVLDVGVGAGRTTRYLAPVARRYEAIDYSPVMIEHMREAFPTTSVRQADLRALTPHFADETFDFVFASNNVIDALCHEDRMQALGEVRRVLRPNAVFAFSSHNLEYAHAYDSPSLEWSRNPITLARHLASLVTRLFNHRRIGAHRMVTPEYAILNDEGQNFACLHYYAARETVASQLRRSGMHLLDVFDVDGQTLRDGQETSACPSLLYVAQRVPDA